MSRLAEECRVAVGTDVSICSIGVAAPATMDVSRGVIHYSPNLPMINGLHLSSKLQDSLGLRVVLENDATSAAIGEHWLGASRDVESSICITLGTGVGGGIILQGKPLRGPDGTAGELGHVCVEPNGHSCGCGSWGCLEQYASATAVVRIAREIAQETPDSVLHRSDTITAEDVYEAAINGDTVGIRNIPSSRLLPGHRHRGTRNVLNPEAVVIGGGMSAAWMHLSIRPVSN